MLLWIGLYHSQLSSLPWLPRTYLCGFTINSNKKSLDTCCWGLPWLLAPNWVAKDTKYVVSEFWRPEVQIEDVDRAVPIWELRWGISPDISPSFLLLQEHLVTLETHYWVSFLLHFYSASVSQIFPFSHKDIGHSLSLIDPRWSHLNIITWICTDPVPKWGSGCRYQDLGMRLRNILVVYV